MLVGAVLLFKSKVNSGGWDLNISDFWSLYRRKNLQPQTNFFVLFIVGHINMELQRRSLIMRKQTHLPNLCRSSDRSDGRNLSAPREAAAETKSSWYLKWKYIVT